MSNWVKVFESKQEHKIGIVKDILVKKEIESVIMNKKDTAYNIFGQYEIHVEPKNAVRAIRIIENDIKFE
ncbi:MAG: hypothetical protein ABFS32_20240 [Bacteroidota bacterium]